MVQHTYVLAEIKFVCCRVFPTLGGDACDADMYPEVKLKPDTEIEKVKTNSELIERISRLQRFQNVRSLDPINDLRPSVCNY